jgi:hypothetical protein
MHGRYAVYAPFTVEEVATLTGQARKRCLDHGYRVPQQRLYCPYRPDNGRPIDPLQVGPQGDGEAVRWEEDGKPSRVVVRLRRLAPDLHLVQFTAHPDEENRDSQAYYALLRWRGAAIELLWASCGDAPEELRCEVRSIDAIAPRLLAYGKDLNNAPVAVFSWLGD